jgi:hypothetical protein
MNKMNHWFTRYALALAMVAAAFLLRRGTTTGELT